MLAGGISLGRFQDNPRALAQRQTSAGILLDGGMEGRLPDYDQAGAGEQYPRSRLTLRQGARVILKYPD